MAENNKNVANNVLTGVSIASAGVGLAVSICQLVGIISAFRADRRARKAAKAAEQQAE